jgi:hypothetical protein
MDTRANGQRTNGQEDKQTHGQTLKRTGEKRIKEKIKISQKINC